MLRRLRLGYISESWKCLSPESSSIVPTALSHRMNDDFFYFSGIILFYIKNTNSDVWQQFLESAVFVLFIIAATVTSSSLLQRHAVWLLMA